jgi:hypothetical protein
MGFYGEKVQIPLLFLASYILYCVVALWTSGLPLLRFRCRASALALALSVVVFGGRDRNMLLFWIRDCRSTGIDEPTR